MEKGTPHCKLEIIQSLARDGKIRATYSALAGGAALDLDFAQMVNTVMKLTPREFFKSMTTHNDSRIWQDVYRPVTEEGPIYMKFTVDDGVLIVSFKEL
jgi:motility quorum-sensing regulator/GCU-specific mRNA interferase toxin